MNITPLECLLFSELGGSICCRTMERSPLSLFICLIYPPLNMKGESSMSEAIITRRGYTAEGKPELRTELIQTNQNWVVPQGVRGNISVRIFGGGGGGTYRQAGGGGWMNNGELSVTSGQSIRITIGEGGPGGKSVIAGGTTSFGTYLSAVGGSTPPGENWIAAGSGGSGGGGGYGRGGGTGYQFGGGGGASSLIDTGSDKIYPISGGGGGIWGGGGGTNGSYYIYPDLWNTHANFGRGGNGGTYGGGGGGLRISGKGGIYGGSGGNYTTNGKNGTNTIGNESVPVDCQGNGRGGNICGGGGGFGGRGGNGFYNVTYDDQYLFGTGGGGGYGGNGGRGTFEYGGGGGGGYGKGADGGNNLGGGGGYFARGGNGGDEGGGGGGAYGPGGDAGRSGKLGSGGGANTNGGDGICIIQYYT